MPERLRRSAASRILVPLGGILLGIAIVAAVAAPILAPHDPFVHHDPVVGRHLPPGSEAIVVHLPDGRTVLADRLDPGPPLRYERLGRWVEPDGTAVAEDVRFVLGTDRYGRDVLSRLLWGARTSLAVGVSATALALVVGLAWGLAAGSAPPLVDRLLMRSADALLAFPRIVLVLVLAALWRPTGLTLVVLLGVTGWMELTRIVRAEVGRIRGRGHVEAARATGAGPVRVALRHVLPLLVAPVAVHTALRVGDVILTEAALSFLGFGIQPPTPSWGTMIGEAGTLLPEAWWAVAAPGVALVLTVFAFNLLADGFADRLDPTRRADPLPATEV